MNAITSRVRRSIVSDKIARIRGQSIGTYDDGMESRLTRLVLPRRLRFSAFFARSHLTLRHPRKESRRRTNADMLALEAEEDVKVMRQQCPAKTDS